MKNLTWQQVALIAVLVGAVIGAHFLGDSTSAAVISTVTTVLAWFMRSPGGDAPPPATPMVLLLAVGLSVSACSGWMTKVDEVQEHNGILAHCRNVGRDAGDGGHIKAYDECKKEAGIQ